MLFRQKRNILIIILLVSAFGISIVWGAREIWKMPGLMTDQELSGDALREIEKTLKDGGESSHAEFNLAVVYYRQQDYEKASAKFLELLDSGNNDSEMNSTLHYNLGNSFYRMAELVQESDLGNAVELLTRSLGHYRIIIDEEKQKEKYSGTPVKRDEDALFNYTLARKKLKIFRDKLARQQQEQAGKKQLYQMLVELRENEKRIAEQLEKLKMAPLSKESLELRKKLMQQQEENLDQLKLIKDKMVEAVKG